jgi:hypothetical protein
MSLSKISRFPVWLAASGDRALSIVRIGAQWHWLVQLEGRDVVEGLAPALCGDAMRGRERGALPIKAT